MNEDGGCVFIFNLGEDDSFEHKCVLEEMLKDLTKERADEFVHQSSRYCNTGWPEPSDSPLPGLPLGSLYLGAYHLVC